MRASHLRSRSTRRPAASRIQAFFLYGEPQQPPDERLVHIETIAARSRLHDWHIRPHRHRDLHQLLLIHRGRVAARVDEASRSLRSPAMILVPPGIVHTFRFQPGTLGLVISFAPGIIPELQSADHGLVAFLERPALAALDRTRMRVTDVWRLAEMLLREFSRSAPGRPLALRGLLAGVLANALRLAPPPAAADTGASTANRELLARFRRLIEAHYREHFSVAAYATALHMTQSRLRRVCLSVCGQSPVELIHLRLLVEAERQLRYTTMPISRVAYYLGFEDPAYFTRFFARRLRISPRAFRTRDGATMVNVRA